MPVIQPTPGRIVWYHPAAEEPFAGATGADPLAAMVVCVHGERTVNLVVYDKKGGTHPRENVTLLQDDVSVRPSGAFCEWMPYQQKMATRDAEAERRDKAAADSKVHSEAMPSVGRPTPKGR